MKKTILRSAVLGGVLGLATGFAVMATVMAAPQSAEVKIDNFTFAPQSVTIKAGTTVT
jgi:plastocyanin